MCVSVCVQEGKTASSSGEKTPGGPRGKGSHPSGYSRQLWVPSTCQTSTVLSPLSWKRHPHPRQMVASLLLWGGRPQLEAASPRGQSRQGGAGSHEVWEPRGGPRRQFRVAPHVRCGLGLLDRAARAGRRSGVCPGLRFCSGPGWAGAWEPLRGPPSPSRHQRVPWGPHTALQNWTLESPCTLTPAPHLGGLALPTPRLPQPPRSWRVGRLGEGVGALEGKGPTDSLGWGFPGAPWPPVPLGVMSPGFWGDEKGGGRGVGVE